MSEYKRTTRKGKRTGTELKEVTISVAEEYMISTNEEKQGTYELGRRVVVSLARIKGLPHRAQTNVPWRHAAR